MMKWALSRKNLWRRFPRAVRGLLGRGLGLVPPQYLLGHAFRRNARFAREAQWWPTDQARQYQLDALRRILVLAYEETRYYHRVFDALGFQSGDLRSLEGVAMLPLIDRDTVRDHLGDMCTRPVEHHSVDCCSTGGTGGKPLSFYIGKERSSVEYADLTTSWQRVGYRLGTPMAVLRGEVVCKGTGGLHHEYDPLLRHHYYSAFHMSDENMGRYLAHIASIGPCYLHVYPSTVAALARFIRRSGLTPPSNIRGIIAESEIVYPEQRRMVEEVFGCRYFSCYGQSEKVVLASECEYSTDYHVWPTYGYFELLDEQGNPVTTPGQRGEIVGTGFINTVVPFIRYRTGDYATYVGDHCEACGRRHPIIRDIRGHRSQELLIAADGSEISWAALNMHDDTFHRVWQFQFRQDTPGRAVLRVVPAEGFGEEDRRRVYQNLGRKLSGRINFTVELVDSILLTPRGKAIYVDQRITTTDQCAKSDVERPVSPS